MIKWNRRYNILEILFASSRFPFRDSTDKIIERNENKDKKARRDNIRMPKPSCDLGNSSRATNRPYVTILGAEIRLPASPRLSKLSQASKLTTRRKTPSKTNIIVHPDRQDSIQDRVVQKEQLSPTTLLETAVPITEMDFGGRHYFQSSQLQGADIRT
jgi:hypothetical protein